MAGLVADGERVDLPDGMFLSIWFNHIRATDDETTSALRELEDAGVILKFDEPDGWLIKNWVERTRVVRSTSLEAVEIKWGQKSAHRYFARRKADVERKQLGVNN